MKENPSKSVEFPTFYTCQEHLIFYLRLGCLYRNPFT